MTDSIQAPPRIGLCQFSLVALPVPNNSPLLPLPRQVRAGTSLKQACPSGASLTFIQFNGIVENLNLHDDHVKMEFYLFFPKPESLPVSCLVISISLATAFFLFFFFFFTM